MDRPEGLGRLRGASSQPPASAEAGGGSGACRRAATTRAVSDWRELDDDWQRQVVGWAKTGEAQVRAR